MTQKLSLMNRISTEYKSGFLLTFIMALVALIVAAISMFSLFNAAMEEARARLIETTQSQVRIIEAVARFDKAQGIHVDSFAASLSQVREAYENFEGLGKTGEFALARRDEDQIAYLFRQRHQVFVEPISLVFDGNLAEPMRRALQGESGSIIGLDYRGEKVLAAYAPIAELDLGIVTKIDLKEVYEPFVRAGWLTVLATLLLVFIGSWFFQRITGRMMRRIEEDRVQFQKIFESTSDTIMLLDKNGFIDCNPATLKMFGCKSRKEFLNHHPSEFSPPTQADNIDSRVLADEKIATAYEEGTNFFEWTHRHSNGKDFPTEVLLTHIERRKGGFRKGDFLQATVRDISRRKQAEQAELAYKERLECLIASSQDGIIAYDMDILLTVFNPAMEQLSGIKAEQVLGSNVLDTLPFFKEKKGAEAFSKAIKGQTSRQTEIPFNVPELRKSGFFASAHFPLYNSKRIIVGGMAIIHDVTENIQAAKMLKESERRFQRMAATVPDILYSATVPGFHSTYVSPAVKDLFGMTPEEWLSDPDIWIKQMHSEDRERVLAQMTSAFEKGESMALEYRMWRKDNGRLCHFEDRASWEKDSKGNIILLQGVMTDITARNQAKEKILKHNALLDAISKSQSVYINKTDPMAIFKDALDHLLALTDSECGFIAETCHEKNGTPYIKSLAISDVAWDKASQEMQQIASTTGLEFRNPSTLFGAVVTSGKPVISNDPANDPRSGGLPKGHPPVNSFLGIPFFKGDVQIGIFCIANRPDGYDQEMVDYIQPFTDTLANMVLAVARERVLIKSETRFRGVFESEMIGNLFWNTTGVITDANDTFLETIGYTREEFLSSTIYWSDITPPEFKAQDDKALQEIIDTGITTPIEKEYIRKDGSRIPVLMGAAALPESDLNGVAFVMDITERKRVEQALHASEKQIRLLLDSTAEAIYGIDTDGVCTLANAACLRMLGYDDTAELIGRNMHELMHHTRPDGSSYPEERCRLTRALLADKNIHVDDELFWRKDGSCFPVSYWSYPIRKGVEIVGAVVTFLDITEQLKAQSSLAESHEHLRTALEGTIAAIGKSVEARDPYTAGHQHRVAELAVAIALEMGLNENQIKGIYMGASIHDIGKIYLPAEILSKPSKLSNIEYNLIKAHPQVGYNILKDINFPWPVANIAHQHHECMDGSGYPQGLRGDEICLEARIVTVADVVEAISSDRPYRAALGIEIALKVIKAGRGKFYDPEVVDACLTLVVKKKFDFIQFQATNVNYSVLVLK